MRAAPLKLNPNINIANNLFIETPLTLRMKTIEKNHIWSVSYGDGRLLSFH
ncbi:hypothetical protein OAS1_18270 [Bacillus sp. YKCMOAS1]|nr:hypothetical protein OAS1_18270 [Bacillus sp. YKCMOAS1]